MQICKKKKKRFSYKKYLRDYIKLYSQLYLSDVFSKHFLCFCNIFFTKSKIILLRWLVGLKLIQLEQQKTKLPFIILAKNLKPILRRVIKGT